MDSSLILLIKAVLHLPITARTRRLRPKRVPFFSLRVYERVGILLSEVYEGVRKSVVLACERAQRANR